MPLGAWRGRWRLLKELNPRTLRRAADAVWTLRLDGDPAAVGRLARSLAGHQAADAPPPMLQLPPDVWRQLEGPAAAYRLALRLPGEAGPTAAAPRQQTIELLLLPAPLGSPPSDGPAAGAPLLRFGAGMQPPDLGPLAEAVAQLEAGANDLGVALARRLPGFREPWIARLIEDSARANAAYAFGTGLAEAAPGMGLLLAPADVFILTKNQLLLAFKVALASGRQESNRDLLVQLLGVLGSGLLFRQVARELVGLLPVIGLVPKVAVAYAGTQVIGQIAWAWADEERRLSGPERHRLYHQALQAATAWARSLLPQALRAPEPPVARPS